MNKKRLRLIALLLVVALFTFACRDNNTNPISQSDPIVEDIEPLDSGTTAENNVEVPTPAPDSDNPDLVQPDPPDPDTPSESGDEDGTNGDSEETMTEDGDDVGTGNGVETNADGTQEAAVIENMPTAESEPEPDDEATPSDDSSDEAATEVPEPSDGGSADTNVHIIEPGESLSRIAEQYNISADVLAVYNEIDDVDSIRSGDAINIPSGAIAAAIAQQLDRDVPVETVAETTDTTDVEEAPTEEETLPEPYPETEGEEPPVEETPLPEGEGEGEEAEPTPYPETEGEEAPTEEEALPEPYPETEGEEPPVEETPLPDGDTGDDDQLTYTVESGDGLAYISIYYDVDIDDLAAANNLASYDDIKVGQVLVIPGGSDSGADADDGAGSDTAMTEPTRHEVVFGDKLDNIAEFYNLPMQSIMDANNIDNPDLIKLGQILIIPTE